MRGKKAHLQTPSPKADPPVVPKSDLWDKLEAIEQSFARPSNSFTAKEYATQFGLTNNEAAHRIRKLIAIGKVERIPMLERKAFFRIK